MIQFDMSGQHACINVNHTIFKEKIMKMYDQAPKNQRKLRSSSQYFIGLGIGLVPLTLMLIALGRLISPSFGLLLYLDGILIVASIVCLSLKEMRFVGYGLLTMVIVLPILSFIVWLIIVTQQVHLYG